MPELDFTWRKYQQLCREILDSGYEIMAVAAYLKEVKTDKKVVVMRHDVDRLLGKAAGMARLEKSLGIRTTYYFRQAAFSNPTAIRDIAKMGHEVGYHYEVLDESRGNPELAIQLFKQHLGDLRKIATVETACMHGNPLTRWVNRDIWKYYNYQESGLLGEAFLSLKDLYYLSDTGRIWDMSRKVKDWLPGALPEQVQNKTKIISTDDVIRFIRGGRQRKIYLTVHPERWSDNLAAWLFDQTRDTGMNATKRVFLRRR